MLDLIARVRSRLANGAYANEAAISHGVVSPLLNALGWDSSDPDQMVPSSRPVKAGSTSLSWAWADGPASS